MSDPRPMRIGPTPMNSRGPQPPARRPAVELKRIIMIVVGRLARPAAVADSPACSCR